MAFTLKVLDYISMPQSYLLCTWVPIWRASSVFKVLRDYLQRLEEGVLLVCSSSWVEIQDSQRFLTERSDSRLFMSPSRISGICKSEVSPGSGVEVTLSWLPLVYSSALSGEFFLFICSAKLFIIPRSTFKG